MNAVLLLAALSLGQAEEAKLLARLDADVEKLLKDDPQVPEVREAARLLAETNNSDRWTNYSAATKILRQTRSKASIPLLLAYMVRHSDFGSSHISVAEYAETLTILTGKEIANPYQYVADRRTPVRQAVEKLVAEWWEPQRDKISTDMEEWSAAQFQVVASRLLKREAWQLRGSSTDPDSWGDGPTSYAIYHLLYYHVMTSGSDGPSSLPEELHPKMAPTWLAAAGYRPEPKQAPQRDASRPAYAAVPLLAAVRKNGELDELDEISDDQRQTAGTRLTCVMALHRAGEKLRTPVLLSIAAGDKNLERRLVAILALRYSDERKAGEVLTKLLDEENAEVRTAAICALTGPRPPQAVPKLKRAIDALDPPQAMWCALDVLGKYESREACEALAGFLAAGLEDRQKAKHLYNALSALESATGQRWGEAGAQGDEFYRAKAKIAIEWWKEEGRRTFE